MIQLLINFPQKAREIRQQRAKCQSGIRNSVSEKRFGAFICQQLHRQEFREARQPVIGPESSKFVLIMLIGGLKCFFADCFGRVDAGGHVECAVPVASVSALDSTDGSGGGRPAGVGAGRQRLHLPLPRRAHHSSRVRQKDAQPAQSHRGNEVSGGGGWEK